VEFEEQTVLLYSASLRSEFVTFLSSHLPV
jgi:hypothetical protein